MAVIAVTSFGARLHRFGFQPDIVDDFKSTLA